MANIDSVLTAADRLGKTRRPLGNNAWIMQCPAHDDRNPSCSVSDKGDKIVFHCFAGCATDSIIEALGLTWADLFDEPLTVTENGYENLSRYIFDPVKVDTATSQPKEHINLGDSHVTNINETIINESIIDDSHQPMSPIEYIYRDLDGVTIGKKVRYTDTDGKKTFRQYRYDNGNWLPGLNGIDLPLYNADLIPQAIANNQPIFIVEGEKDADTVSALGEIAVTMPNGAGSWQPRYTDQLQGITAAYLIPDRDEPGIKHAATVKDALEAANIGIRLLMPVDRCKDITDHINAGNDLADLIDADAEIAHQQMLQREAQLQKLTDEEILKQTARNNAKKQITDANAATRYALPISVRTLTEELAKPDEDITFIIDQLWPTGANISLTATYKAGKTSTINNIVKALTDGETLFGHFPTHHTGRIAIWNYEVSANQIRRWLREVNIRNTDNISLMNMRGHTWPLTSEYVMEKTIQWLFDNDITTWLIDPLARAFVGSGDENSNQDVGIFLDTLDYIKDQAGVKNLLIAAHTGRNAEQGNNRARGASRFDDWVDARWMLTKDTDGQRWFTADGRDVQLDESRLDWDENNRTQIIHIGIGKKETKTEKVDDIILAILAETNERLSGKELQNICQERHGSKFSMSLAIDDPANPLGRLRRLGLIENNAKGWKLTNNNFGATLPTSPRHTDE